MNRDTGTIGEHPHLRVTTDVAPKGDEQVVTAMRDAADSVPVVRTGPTGITETDSLAMATQADQTAFFVNPVPSTIQNVIGALEDRAVPTDGADAVVDHEPGTMTLPVPDAGPLAVGRRSVLSRCGWADPLASAEWSAIASERAPRR